MLRRRYYHIHNASSMSLVGLLLATRQPSDELIEAHRRIKRCLQKAGVKTYTVNVGRPTPEKLANFPEVQCWVAFTCSMSPILITRDYLCPIITAHEAALAFASKAMKRGARGGHGDDGYDDDDDDDGSDDDSELLASWRTGFIPSYTSILRCQNCFADGIGATSGSSRLPPEAYGNDGPAAAVVDPGSESSATKCSSLSVANLTGVSALVPNPSRGVSVSASDFLAQRTFKGLTLDASSEPSALYEGQSGRSVQYCTDSANPQDT